MALLPVDCCFPIRLLHKHLAISLVQITCRPPASPKAVAVVDAFDYTDHYLASAVSRYDGNPTKENQPPNLDVYNNNSH
ncbi:hypothetical protein YC2023_047186 [Brassica napus]